MDYHHRPSFMRGIRYIIYAQIIIAVVGFAIVYRYYGSIMRGSSIQEHYTQTFQIGSSSHAVAGSGQTNATGEIIYNGLLGSVHIGTREIGSSIYNTRHIDFSERQINTTIYDNMTAYNTLSQQGLIPYHIGRYLQKHIAEKEKFVATINDLNFLSKYTKQTPMTSVRETRNTLDDLIARENRQGVVQNLTEKENDFMSTRTHTGEDTTFMQSSLLQTEQFAYVYNRLHVDQTNTYKDHIDSISKLFDLNPNIIKACIMVEQLRTFYSFKGLFKNLLQTNTYLTVMSQQSFGIGGVKTATAEKLESRLMVNKPDIYNKYFAFSDPQNKDNERIARLTDTKNYYYQILYTAGILYQYKTIWSEGGYNLDERPGVLATLYNIGLSTPHDNADIGGASMNMAGERYSFGGLAMLIYYYLEIYG